MVLRSHPPRAGGLPAAAAAPYPAGEAYRQPQLRPLAVGDLDAVVQIEQRAYAFPWSRGNFTDSLAAGYLAQLLVQPDTSACGVRTAAMPLGYYLAMPGVDEMHLLNITVAPEHEHRGHARHMLRHLMAASLEGGARTLWLEVRESNDRARRLYERWGFQAVGLRKGYYPAPQGQREHAIVMSLPLVGEGSLDAME